MNHVTVPFTMDALLALWAVRNGDEMDASQTILRLADCAAQIEDNEVASKPDTVIGRGKFLYEIMRVKRRAKFAVDAFVDIMSTLSQCEPSLPHTLSLVAPSNSRNHIARSKAEVYPRRPDLSKNAREFYPGWFVGINISNPEKRKILRLTCNILKLEFGKDIKFG